MECPNGFYTRRKGNFRKEKASLKGDKQKTKSRQHTLLISKQSLALFLDRTGLDEYSKKTLNIQEKGIDATLKMQNLEAMFLFSKGSFNIFRAYFICFFD